MGNEWQVHTKNATELDYEIGVVRKNNAHGIRSYGWHEVDNKIILFGRNHNYLSENFDIKPTQDQLETGIKIAEMFCKMLNEMEGK